MKIKKGQLLKIDHVRKGLFVAVALRDFESEEEIWFPVATTEGCDGGLGTAWAPGEKIPCRASFVRSIEPVEVAEECPKCGSTHLLMNAMDGINDDYKLYTCQNCYHRFNPEPDQARLDLDHADNQQLSAD